MTYLLDTEHVRRRHANTTRLRHDVRLVGEPRHRPARDADDDGHVELSVADRGPGIPRREHRRIFERFYRIDDRLNRKQEGSGLGLAIVRHVVQAHGGEVLVRNRADGGAEFSIRVPAAS